MIWDKIGHSFIDFRYRWILAQTPFQPPAGGQRHFTVMPEIMASARCLSTMKTILRLQLEALWSIFPVPGYWTNTSTQTPLTGYFEYPTGSAQGDAPIHPTSDYKDSTQCPNCQKLWQIATGEGKTCKQGQSVCGQIPWFWIRQPLVTIARQGSTGKKNIVKQKETYRLKQG